MASNPYSDDMTPLQAKVLDPSEPSLPDFLRAILKPIASLKITVVLFFLAICIVLFGTLAQTRMDISAVTDGYFRTSIAYIEIQALLPQSFFPNHQNVPGWFFFPGGWLIGAAMAINLLAAHLIRFKIQAKGARLVAGLATISLGMALTAAVIASGSNKDGVQGISMISFSKLWIIMQASLAATWLAMAYALFCIDPRRKLEFWSLIVGLTGLGVLLGWILVGGESVALNDSSMRIVWQLTKGGLAGLVLLAGCVLVFKKRAGVVLLHAGIGLLMFSELLVGTIAKEAVMILREGETINYLQDTGTIELAVTDSSAADTDDVVVIPESLITDGSSIKYRDLPFDIRVVKVLKNSTVLQHRAKKEDHETAGMARFWKAINKRSSTGTDIKAEANLASIYIQLFDKEKKQSLGTHLATQHLIPDSVVVDNIKYEISLRFKRTYTPYSMHLVDVDAEMYKGTTTPKDYSSQLQLVDIDRNIRQDVRIWMNNPLRFAGQTFYQSGYFKDPRTGEETTTLQVVTNTGWMIPYVSCMIVGVGMLAHFSVILLRFLRNRSNVTSVMSTNSPFADGVGAPASVSSKKERKKPVRSKKLSQPVPIPKSEFERILGIALPAAFVLLAGGLIASMAKPVTDPLESMHIREFGTLPVLEKGRIKPLDTIARTSLRAISDRETFVDSEGKRQPAIKWLLDVISQSDAAIHHDVIRIENLDVLNTLGLIRKKRYRYSLADVEHEWQRIREQVEQAGKLDASKHSLHQKKLIELVGKHEQFRRLHVAFSFPEIKPDPQTGEFNQRDIVLEKMRMDSKKRPGMELPQAVPPTDPKGKWLTLRYATLNALDARQQARDFNAATKSMFAMLLAYRDDDATAFNAELANYQKLLAANIPNGYEPKKTSFEMYYSQFAPLELAKWMYLGAFVLGAFAWLGWSKPLNRASLFVILLALGIHTFALAARMYISGRTGVTVTNLYSSAVFISWGCVVLGLVLEFVYRLGIGNIVACKTGFAALMIATNLAKGNDTFSPLQAVLDTNFWLATHVTCITLGYATTFLAGGLGILYIFLGVTTPTLTPAIAKDLNRMIYGTICFSIFFSFIGTVLGGLWADDSWGRFWGWDPKENGALMIVLWNALVLHARWGGMVKPRGLAVLVVAGNIVVAWSWFGVNELGAGLHSYGFTEGVLYALLIFVCSQLIVMGIGMIPQDRWWSSIRHGNSGKKGHRKPLSS